MTTVTPDLAEKVLGADLRNVVKSVSDGERLSLSEYERMQQATVGGVPTEDLQAARLAALLRRFATGKALTKDQKVELSGVLPVGKPIAKRVTSETYRYKLAHYVGALGLQGKDPERKLKRWIAKGREQTPPDLPPFDTPHMMAEWWRRNMEWRVPFHFLELEQGHADAGASAAAVPAPEAATSPPPAPAPALLAASGASTAPAGKAPAADGEAMFLDMGADVSSDLGLMQIRALVVGTFKQLQRCLEQGLISQANTYRREWQTLVGTLRQWEKDIVKIQEGKGEVMRTRVINTELVRIFSVMRQSFTNEMLALAEQLKPELPPADRRELVLGRRDKCFMHLKSTRFASTYQPPANG